LRLSGHDFRELLSNVVATRMDLLASTAQHGAIGCVRTSACLKVYSALAGASLEDQFGADEPRQARPPLAAACRDGADQLM